MLAYRTSVQESTGCTPFYLMFGREAHLPADVTYRLPPSSNPIQVNQYALDLRLRLESAYQRVRERIGLQHQQQKALYDRAAHGRPYAVHDMVWLHCPAVPRGKSPKLHHYWQGPYREVSDVLFLLQQGDSRRRRTVVHFDTLKPCVTLTLLEATPLEEIMVQRDEDRETSPLKEANTQQRTTIT